MTDNLALSFILLFIEGMTQISEQNTENDVQEHSAPSHSTAVSDDVSAAGMSAGLPSPLAELNVGVPAHLRDLTDRARTYVEAASSANTRRAYASDWKHFTAWCRRQNLSPLPPNPEVVGLYITACASGSTSGSPSGTRSGKPNSVSTIERRLAAIGWNAVQRGMVLDCKDRAIATVMAGIRNTHATPPRQKEALLPEDLIAMLETLDRGTLRGLRDRAMLLIGFAGGLRRSEITGLDLGRDQTEDGRGWIEILDKGLLITLRGKTGWREVEVGRGSSDATCPVIAVETWIKFAKLAKGPVFRRVTGKGKNVGPDRLNDQEVARLVKKAALAAGVRGDLSEADREKLFGGHSLRAGLASSAEVDERYVQKQLGHASADMTRKYQRRRDRFRVNLTKAAGI
jgi:integrase